MIIIRRELMKSIISILLIAFLCSASVASALTLEDTAAIQDSCKSFVDNGQVKRINVSVLPTDGIIYNITATSQSSVLLARLVGVTAFSRLTYSHPEVTYGWIGIFLDNISGESPVFYNIYNSDLSPIIDRMNPSQSDALRVMNNIINARGKSSVIKEHPEIPLSPTTISMPETPKPVNAPYSSYSSYTPSSSSSDCEKVYVEGYYRKDGTYVRPHYRNKPGCS